MLNKLPAKEQKKAIRQESRAAIKPIMADARGRVKRRRRSGKLAKSIRVRSIKRSRSRVGSRVTTRAKDFDGDFYAPFDQLGWKAGAARRNIEGKNDMKDAAETKQNSVVTDYKNRIKKRIENTAKNA